MTENDFVVTPWEVRGDIDYDKLVEKFGTKRIDEKLLSRIKKHSGELHRMLRRDIFYSHRGLDRVLTEYEKGNPFVLYTGRGPSGHTHLGHLMPWIFTKYLQDAFKTKLLFQITDDEKFLLNEGLSLDDTRNFAYENILDIIALGFDSKNTEIFLDTELIKSQYKLALRVAKKITFSTIKATFGFNDSSNIGMIFFTSIQSVPCFLESNRRGKDVPVLIPCAIDQDPHFRLTRDVAKRIGYPKPALIHCKFFPSLQGSDKMSASNPESSIYTIDPPETARKKIMNAFTGGRETIKEQREKGGNPDVCSVYQYLLYIFEDDDRKIKGQYELCRRGELTCGDHKKYLSEKVEAFLVKHQENRERAKDRIEEYMVRD